MRRREDIWGWWEEGWSQTVAIECTCPGEMYIQEERGDIKDRRNQNGTMTQSDCLLKVIQSSWKFWGFISKFPAVKDRAVGEGLARVYNAISHTDKAGMINQWYDRLLSSSSRGNEGNMCTVTPRQLPHRQTGKFTLHIHTLGAIKCARGQVLHSSDRHVWQHEQRLVKRTTSCWSAGSDMGHGESQHKRKHLTLSLTQKQSGQTGLTSRFNLPVGSPWPWNSEIIIVDLGPVINGLCACARLWVRERKGGERGRETIQYYNTYY